MQCVQDLFISVSIERKILVGHLNSVQRPQFNVVWHQSVGKKGKETVPQWKRERREVPRAAYCASASSSVAKNFPVSSKDRSVKDAVPGQEDGKDRGEGRECNQAQRKELKQRSSPHRVEAKGNGAQEGNSTLLHCTLGKTT